MTAQRFLAKVNDFWEFVEWKIVDYKEIGKSTSGGVGPN